MSDDIEHNPGAFACASEAGYQGGMSLRDYFAAQLMGTLIGYHGFVPDHDNYQRAARDSYKAADALLSERASILLQERGR